MMIESKKSKITYLSCIHLIFGLFALLCILPIAAIISISLSNENDLVSYGYRLLPKALDITAYKFIFKNPTQILRSYYVSSVVTVAGAVLSLLIVSMTAYPLSRSDFKYRNKMSLFIYFTMLFSGGLVPWYMLIDRYLGLKDTIWVLIIPLLVSPWNIFLLRTYFQKIPPSLIESANIDGAGELYAFFKIIVPLSKPALATVGLFTALMYWNDSFTALLFIYKANLVPLQYILYKIMTNIQMLSVQMKNLPTTTSATRVPTESARMAMVILAAGPMLFVFPFFQKYFVKGLTVGSVKG